LPLRSVEVNVWLQPFGMLEFQDPMGFHEDQTHLEVEFKVSEMENVIFLGIEIWNEFSMLFLSCVLMSSSLAISCVYVDNM